MKRRQQRTDRNTRIVANVIDGVEYDQFGRRFGLKRPERAGKGCEVGQWKWANRARREAAMKKRGLTSWPPPEVQGPGRWSPEHNRNARAIRQCVAALSASHGNATIKDAYHREPSEHKADGTPIEPKYTVGYDNMGPFLRRWWPVCLAAYRAGLCDLL